MRNRCTYEFKRNLGKGASSIVDLYYDNSGYVEDQLEGNNQAIEVTTIEDEPAKKLDSLMDCKQDLILPKGMKIGMTTEELVSAWGKPSNDVETYPDTYIYKESDESRDIVRFHIDMNTNTIENITINYHKEQ